MAQQGNSGGSGGFGIAGALGGMANTGINAWSNANQNRKSRLYESVNDVAGQIQNQLYEYDKRMYDRDQLIDQRNYDKDIWNMQNEFNIKMLKEQRAYDSPMAQMQRFKDANLNPNLIYGQMSNGSMPIGASDMAGTKPNPAGSPSVDSKRTASFNPIRADIGNPLMAFLDAKREVVTIDNLQAQNDAIKANTKLTIAKQLSELTRGERQKFDLSYLQETKNMNLEQLRGLIKKNQSEVDLNLGRNWREGKKNTQDIEESAQRIKLMKGQDYNNALDSLLKGYEINLNNRGLQKGDSWMLRVLMEMADEGYNYYHNKK